MGHREDLLVAARRLLETKGYARITARDLVAESGSNLASIGYHFGSKEGLLNEVIATVFNEWVDQLAAIAMADPDAAPLDRARATWSALLAGLPKRRPLLVSYVEALAQAEHAPQLREQFGEHYRGVRARVAALVAQSLRGAIGADDPRASAIASWMIAVCDGLALQWLVDPGSMPSAADLKAGHTLMWQARTEATRRSASS